MGQAKRRGTFEERVKCAQAATAIINKVCPYPRMRYGQLAKFNGNKIALAMAIVDDAKRKAESELTQSSSPATK
jgi:hypothetical protein